MKRTAGGLLVAAAAVFLVSFALPDTTLVGFVRAAAEAAMIGGLADWFAVTALFRHPLGLRVPHTALIPRQKDVLATKLGQFLTGNFLTPDLVAAHVVDARLVHRLGQRLSEGPTAGTLAREVATTAAAVLGSLDARHVSEYVLTAARRDVQRRSYAPLLGGLLKAGVEGAGQEPIVDVAVRRTLLYLRAHRDEVRPQLKAFIERLGVLGLLLATDKRVDRLIDVGVRLLEEMEHEGATHPLRRWFDGLLLDLAEDLRHDPRTIEAVDTRTRELVESARVADLVHRAVADLLASTRESLLERDSPLEAQLTRLVRGVGERIVTDADFEARLVSTLDTMVRYVVEHYGDQAVGLIQRTVAGWDGRDTAERIEVAVGRDLQFIRINGTIVGALAGTAIHAVAVLMG